MRPGHLFAVLCLFTLSGGAGLIYEASWARQVGLVLGMTERTAAVVLAAWFLGIALGSWVGGCWVARSGRPLVGYAVAELVAGVWALAVPALLGTFEGVAMTGLLDPSWPVTRLLFRASAVLIILLPSTAALGATLPLLAHLLSGAGRGAGLVLGAYGLNLAGGGVGLLAATFWLLVHTGVQGTGQLAAGISCFCGLAALMLNRSLPGRSEIRAPKDAEGSASDAAGTAATVGARWTALAAISGATALGLEVLYLRLFARTLQNSSYTLGAVVAAFLVALALGSGVAARWLRRQPVEDVVVRAAGIAAVATPLSLLLFRSVTQFGALQPPGESFGGYMAFTLGLVGMVVIPPVTAVGMLLPCALFVATGGVGSSGLGGHQERGHSVGRLAAVNVLAAAAGALLTSYVLLGIAGIMGCFSLFAVGLLLLSIAWNGLVQCVRMAALATACLVLIYTVLMGPASRLRTGEKLLASWDTPHGLIEVIEAGENRTLNLDVHYLMGDTAGAGSERNQGHLSLLLHPHPARVSFLGLATGITAAAALDHPAVKEITIVELIPQVVQASHLFKEQNQDLLSDPRGRLVVEDARQFLRTGVLPPQDVIVADLYVPWHSRTGYLYTVEYFRAVRSRLAKGGIFVQWISLRQVGRRELALIADSLALVFPRVTLWREPAHPRIICLVGKDGPLALDQAALNRRLARLASSSKIAPVHLSRATDLMKQYLGRWPRQPGAVLNTDEHPRLEFLAPITQRSLSRPLAARLREFQRDLFDRLPRPEP